ncbi:hypothetical protein BD779DRAFT_1670745 [Infundibulicybe gibba]|nr:hypothetical protein BD779DRAFT_1670745 [Infundibulicybe gibba]
MSDLPDEVFSTDSRTLAPAAVGAQVLLMGAISVVTILAFNILRPKNKIIYEPKVKYHVGDKPPPRISDSVFGWLPPLIHTKEPELVEKIGLDAVAFLRFTRLMRWLFTGIALLTCGILIPINAVYNLRNVPLTQRDLLTMLTIRNVGGSFLYAHVAVTYLITLLIVYCVHFHWKEMIRLRRAWFRSPEYLESFYARTLTVLHVPKKLKSDEGLKVIFDSVKVPYPTTSVHIGRKVGRLPELIEYHNTTVRELETVLVKFLKGGKVGNKRPTIRVGGTCGCGGTKKDAIEFYTTKLKRTEASIEEYRAQIDTRKAENYAPLKEKSQGAKVLLAPNPKDIIWENMNKADGEIARKRFLGFLWLGLVCFFNTLPLFIISFLANLNSLRTYVPFLQSWFNVSPRSFAFVSGVLPPAVSGIFGFFLPIVMRWLTQYMGALTHSKLDRAVIARYFAFLVISQLVVFTLIGVVFISVKEIVDQVGKGASFQQILDNLHTLPDKINRTYIDQSSYWLTFFPLRGFLVVFDLAQIINLVWISFKTHVFGRTPRDIREWTQPPDFQYAIYYSNLLFMGAVGLVFAPLAPLVVLAAAVVFWMGSWVYKYQLMFVFVSKVETGGRLWNVVINRLLFTVLIMQTLMILTIGLQYQFRSLQWLSTVPPVLIIFAFKIYINRNFLPAFRYFNPTEDEIRLAQVHSQRSDARGNRLEKRFGHPALNAELFTPMLHAKMMPLLGQVYQGKIGKDQAKLDEYGGQKMEAQVIPGGIKIAGIDQVQLQYVFRFSVAHHGILQHNLEYDPALYQRDRGELDWDARSMASTAMFDGTPSLHPAKSQYYASDQNLPSRVPGYDRYLASGPGSELGHQASDIELAPIDSIQEPLLSSRAHQFASSQYSLTPTLPVHQDSNGSRQAPIHRPQSRSYSPSPAFSPDTQYQQYPPQQRYSHAQHPSEHEQRQQHSRQASNNNMAGRGAHRGY